MAPTAFARSWRDGVDAQMVSEPDFVDGLHGMMARLNDPRGKRAVLDDVISQPWRKARRDWYDAAAQFEVGLHLQAGWCVVVWITLGAAPGRDRDDDQNQAKLDRLPAPYSAWCEHGTHDADGWLSWAEPITVTHRMDRGQLITVRYRPSGVPLEIGHTEPETTIWHLRREGGVARWPYGARRMTLLLGTCSTTGRPVPLERPIVLDGARLLGPPPEAPSWLDPQGPRAPARAD